VLFFAEITFLRALVEIIPAPSFLFLLLIHSKAIVQDKQYTYHYCISLTMSAAVSASGNNDKLLVVFGSQTGNSEETAKEIAAELSASHGIPSEAMQGKDDHSRESLNALQKRLK
jgi:sulfite reductase alpha subunit-like flavoprotein